MGRGVSIAIIMSITRDAYAVGIVGMARGFYVAISMGVVKRFHKAIIMGIARGVSIGIIMSMAQWGVYSRGQRGLHSQYYMLCHGCLQTVLWAWPEFSK